MKEINIRETNSDDLDAIMLVEKLAFGQDEEANLVSDLLSDETAKPIVSILAFDSGKPIGHILFSRAYLNDSQEQRLMHILAPLAVVPEHQGKGIGGQLIKMGLEILERRGSEIVFVLGHENYYPKFGFTPNAEKFGFIPPFPIDKEHANAWMYQHINDGNNNELKGLVKCADQMNKIEYWQE